MNETKLSFEFDTVLTHQNICNLLLEEKLIKKAIHAKQKLIVYGPRNNRVSKD